MMADKASLVKRLEELSKTITRRADEELERTEEWQTKQLAKVNKVQTEIKTRSRVMSKWGDTIDQIQEQLEDSPILKESGLAALTAAIPTGKLSDEAMSLLNQLEDTTSLPSTLTIPKNSFISLPSKEIMTDKETLVRRLKELEKTVSKQADEELARTEDWKKKQLAKVSKVQTEINARSRVMSKWGDTVDQIEEQLTESPILKESGLAALTATIPTGKLSDEAMSLLNQLEDTRTLPGTLTIPINSLFPSGKGKFLQEIILPPGANGQTGIDDLCWTPEGALLVARSLGRQLVKIKLHPETLIMTNREVLHEGEAFSSVSCGRDGSWGAVVRNDHIKLHQPGSSSCQEWRPAEVPILHYLTHYKDEMWVSPLLQVPVRVYGRDLNLRRTINVENKNTLQAITASDGRLIATTAHSGHYLHILSLSDESLVTVGGEGKEDGKFNWPVGVTTDTTGHILVCDFYNKRVSVFTPSGLFLHHLDLEWGDMDGPFSIAVRERVGKPDLMALGRWERIRIYELY